jgi:hypothetical protein
MQAPVRLVALSMFAVIFHLNSVRADQCYEAAAAWNKVVADQLDEGLNRLIAAQKKDTAAETAAGMCNLYKWNVERKIKQLADLKAIQATCGTGGGTTFDVPGLEEVLAGLRKEVTKQCQ